jgi:hypothetical protein
MSRLVVVLVVVLSLLGGRAAAIERNAGKYGAMFYWWYDRLPASALAVPTVRWNANDPAW